MIRYFPKILLTIALLGSLSKNASAQEIGLDLRSFQDQFSKDFPGTMAKVKDLGIKEVSLSDTYGLSFPEIIKQLAVNELSVISFEGEFEKLRDFPQAVADEARSYGAKYVVCSWIPHDTDSFTIADVDRVAEVFVQAGKVMARNGLLLCYQPHGYEFQPYNKGTVFDYITEKFDSRFIQFQMDAFWIRQAGQNPVALLKKYHSRWVLVTLKDRKPGAVNTLDGRADAGSYVALGDGDVGIAEVMKEVKKYGVQHVFIDDQSGRAAEHLPRSISFLKSLEE